MSTVPTEEEIVLGPESAGLLMTPQEFDAIEEYDEEYHYELVNGVLVDTPIPSPEEAGANELLANLLLSYQESHPQGGILDGTLPQQYVRTPTSRHLAYRLIWVGLGRVPNVERDVPTIAVEFVAGNKWNRRRVFVDKRQEYFKAGIREYWIIDRFLRRLTVVRNAASRQREHQIADGSTYESPLLPGFALPVARILATADAWAAAQS